MDRTTPLRISNLVWKEIIQITRDRAMIIMVFLFPLLQLSLMAQATGTRVGDLRLAVLDLDRSSVSRELITALDNREELALWYYVSSPDELYDLLNRGKADVGVIFPRGFGEDMEDPTRTAQVQMIVDGSNSVVGSIAVAGGNGALGDYGMERLAERGFSVQSPIDFRVVTYYNPDYDTRAFTIPAQVGFITYQITLVVASLGLARERELGTLEQLIVAPVTRLELVVGKAVPALIAGVINFALMMGVAVYLFRIPMRGSLPFLFGMTVLFVMAEIGWGGLISAASRTQQQAILLVFIMAMMDITFSGYLVPVRNLPGALRLIAQVVPMYHYLAVIRAVMLKGATLATLWPHALALAGLGVAILFLSMRGISQRLD